MRTRTRPRLSATVTHVTEGRPAVPFNGSRVERRTQKRKTGEVPMFAAAIVTLVIVAALGYATRSGRRGELISRRPYNNRYNDAAGAREDHL